MRDWQDLTEALAAGRIGRREFIGRAAVLGVSATVAAGAFSAQAGAAEMPRHGGHLKVGLNGAGAGDSLDPATYTATFMQVFGHQLYNTMVDVDEHNKPVPGLAESWEAKPGAKEWVFKIRQGVTFSNGKKLTAADVVYTINHHRQPTSKSPAKVLLAEIAELKATGTHEVTFTLTGGNADMPYLVADYHLCIGPEGTSFTDGVGTGAFLLEKFQPGVRGQTKRNPNYWRTGRPFVDSVETLAINDTTARISALMSGAVDMINRVPAESVALLKGSPRVQLFEISGASYNTFPMRCDTAPFTNNDVRLAMKWGIDRKAILDKVLVGHGKIGNDQPIPTFNEFYAADIPQHNYDPDKAKFHLKKSGYSGGFVLSVSDTAFGGAVNAAEIFQQSVAKAGIKLQVQRVPSDGYWDNVWMKVPFCASYWDGRPTADQTFSITFAANAPWNESFWKNPTFNKLLIAARAELDHAKRKQMYHDMQLIAHDDSGEIVPMFNNTIDGGSSKVKGFIQRPTLQMAGYRAPDMVWLEG